ncbi:penicillin-binding transpeptidase domain-containing protein, partial [Sphingobium sp. AN641]|uniref:penicillin-binding transpeptidase domain-containing protein n=1 Tax=Sphingobium sp. AN641 TaxID=3133443 RepID=UPI0030BD1910
SSPLTPDEDLHESDLNLDSKNLRQPRSDESSRTGAIRKQVDRVIAVVLGSAAYDGIKSYFPGSSRQATQPCEESESGYVSSSDDTDTLILILEGKRLRPIDRQIGNSGLFEQFIDWVAPEVNQVAPHHGEPLLVQTTLDLRLQRTAIDTIQPLLPSRAEGVLTTIDRSGAVHAMVGGIGTSAGHGLAIDALREAGSAWRVFVCAEAFTSGIAAGWNFMDGPVRVDGWDVPQTRYAGLINLRTAFAYSKNSVFVGLGVAGGYDRAKGFSRIEKIARHFGISTPISTHPSMPLGTSKVRIIEMARAFAILSAHGKWIDPFGVTKMTTLDGTVVYERKAQPDRVVISADIVRDMTDILQSAAVSGSAKPAMLDRPMAGLAGTSLSSADGWFLGFSSGLTTCVWMGNPDGDAVSLSEGRIPAQAFGTYMRFATGSLPREKFETLLKLPDLTFGL